MNVFVCLPLWKPIPRNRHHEALSQPPPLRRQRHIRKDDRMAQGAFVPLERAVSARRSNTQPTAADLKLCDKYAWNHPDLRCWNGRRADRLDCNFVGSQNIPVYAEAGRGNWDFFVQLAEVWREEGNFGKEIGAPSAFYYSGVLGCMLLAQRELARLGRTRDAETVRLAIRSALAWDTIVALPVTRTHDEALYGDLKGGRTVTAQLPVRVKGPQPARLTVAVSGMRWSTKGRAVLTSEDAHSATLSAELASVDALGLTREEIDTARRCVGGDVQAAREVCGWMYGTIDTPDTQWGFRLRRTELGVESIYLGPWPNPMKPCNVLCQVTWDGLWRTMRPIPETKIGNWASGFKVEVNDSGMVKAECVAGRAEMKELGGKVLWEVGVRGSQVMFNT